jgi:GntR family transcriptional regulator
MIHLDYRDARPIYSQIIDRFREQIAAGILQPGEKLPSVRDLAAELAINPNTIQRAYRQLELEGWIVSMQGKGSFVSGEASIRQRENDRLLEEFDKLVAALERCGTDRRELIARLQKEE